MTKTDTVPTQYWQKLADGRIQCDLCPAILARLIGRYILNRSVNRIPDLRLASTLSKNKISSGLSIPQVGYKINLLVSKSAMDKIKTRTLQALHH